MTHRFFRDIMDLVMCADPSPVDAATSRRIREELNNAAFNRGFKDWIDAYHRFDVDKLGNATVKPR
jgi:hypothetical protein